MESNYEIFSNIAKVDGLHVHSYPTWRAASTTEIKLRWM